LRQKQLRCAIALRNASQPSQKQLRCAIFQYVRQIFQYVRHGVTILRCLFGFIF
jgi:hypothetical protein